MAQVLAHSSIVGGSTASRVINCPGSVALVAKMPPKPSSKYADEGTLLHDVMSDLLSSDKKPTDFLGRKYNDITLTQDLIDEKVMPALAALDEIDPDPVIFPNFDDSLRDAFRTEFDLFVRSILEEDRSGNDAKTLVPQSVSVRLRTGAVRGAGPVARGDGRGQQPTPGGAGRRGRRDHRLLRGEP